MEMGDTNTEEYDYVMHYLPVYKAALNNDWNTANNFFKSDISAATERITYWWETALHIAVGTNTSHLFVTNLVNLIASKDVSKLRTMDYLTNNPLHYAAKVGNTKAAKAIIAKDPEIAQIVNSYGHTALKLAAWYGKKDTLLYLLHVTVNVVGEDGTSPYEGETGGDLITFCVTSGFYDVALYLVEKYPNLAIEKDRDGQTAIQMLATRPSAFPSGLSRWYWLIYPLIPIDFGVAVELTVKDDYINELITQTINSLKEERPCCDQYYWVGSLLRSFGSAVFLLYLLLWRIVKYLIPVVRSTHDKKLMHKCSERLMKGICDTIINMRKHSVAWNVLGTAMSTAAEHGIHELVEECLGRYPGLVWYKIEGLYLLLAAIKNRQVKVFNLVYQMSGHVVFLATNIKDSDNALHLAGRKALPHRLSTVTGSALQMQRELQWFKEVEKFVEPSYKEAMNNENKTPRMVFTEEHSDLVEKGEKWMKDASSSSMVVAALIFTVAFAAVFTIPGGLKAQGTPLFINDSVFKVFVISNAIALFSSATSVLMLLAVFTSRFSENDFLYALPKRLAFGLSSLFLSVVATMVTFSAALALLVREQIAWIAVPVQLSVCVPVTLFAMVDFLPLLLELVMSTYGPSIFRKQSNKMLY